MNDLVLVLDAVEISVELSHERSISAEACQTGCTELHMTVLGTGRRTYHIIALKWPAGDERDVMPAGRQRARQVDRVPFRPAACGVGVEDDQRHVQGAET
jgi:hypothetical protein